MDSSPEALIRRVAAGQDGVVTRKQALAAGLRRHEIDSLVRSGRWSRLAFEAYLVGADGPSRRVRIRTAVASYGPGATAVLSTAAELHGIAGLRLIEEIHISVPGIVARPNRPSDPSVVVHQLVLPPDGVTAIAGISVTIPLYTVAGLILRVPRFPAVCLLDSALNQCLITPDELAAIPVLIHGRRGAVAARQYLAEVDSRAQSPLETRVRLRCIDGRVPPDTLQHLVRDADGYILGRGDLAWLKARLIGEADGRGPHSQPQAVLEDRHRQNRMLNAGWSVLRFTWADTLRPDYIPYVVREALALRRA